MSKVHVLAQKLLGKASLEECNVQELKDLAERYPYYAPAQFLLLQKLKREGSPYLDEQYQKAVLYYHNPLAFEHMISPERFLSEVSLEEKKEPEQVQMTEPVSPAPVPVHESRVPMEEVVYDHPSSIDINEKELVEEIDQQKIEEPVSVQSEAEATIAEKEPELSPETGSVIEASNVNEPVEQNTPSLTPVAEEKAQSMVFEPYYTVDYFASQGIRLSQEEAGKDKFGKQLKSFTEWLKTMKRLPAAETITQIDPSTESTVQHLASDSVHEANVMTEAMAEVWLKQGNVQKALETYNKLSLLNPSKKAYFAAKIENLKRS